MSAPESTAVIPPPPAPAPVTVEHISALHRHLEELRSWVGEKFKEIVELVEKAAPIAAAVAGPVVSPIVAAVEKVSELLGCCPHIDRQHNPDGTCAACPCKGPAHITGA